MTATFNLALKSTLDKTVKGIANAASLDYVDLDGAALNSAKLLEAKNSIAWAQTHYSLDRSRVMFDLVFEVGAITTSDPAQYKSMDITGKLLDAFRPMSQIDVYDYSGTQAGTTKLGDLTILRADVQPLVSNDIEGFRSIAVTAKGVRYG